MTREQAIKRAKEIERSLEFTNEGKCVKCTYEVIADALMEGAELERKEAIAAAGEWIERNVTKYCWTYDDTVMNIDTDSLINDFETEMHKIKKD